MSRKKHTKNPMEYKYFGLELTPSIFKELLIQLFDGEQFDRNYAINTIVNYHVDNGGNATHSTYAPAFKRACQALKGNGIENVGYGIWRLLYEKQEVKTVHTGVTKEKEYLSDKYLGHGDYAIYVYYYDKYKDFANLSGNNVWECKVGRTDVCPINRIFSQTGTCYPECPHLALVIYCDDSVLLEKTLHDILKMKNRWIANAPGNEWFITSPEEIEQIYYAITDLLNNNTKLI